MKFPHVVCKSVWTGRGSQGPLHFHSSRVSGSVEQQGVFVSSSLWKAGSWFISPYLVVLTAAQRSRAEITPRKPCVNLVYHIQLLAHCVLVSPVCFIQMWTLVFELSDLLASRWVRLWYTVCSLVVFFVCVIQLILFFQCLTLFYFFVFALYTFWTTRQLRH